MTRELRTLLLAATLAAGTLAPGLAQESQEVPRFDARADAVTLDVVVLGSDGLPVLGLNRDDFRVFEDGHAVTLVGFDHRALNPAREGQNAEPSRDALASLEGTQGSARTLAFLVDDLWIEPANMVRVRSALSAWLRDRGQASDEVTLTTTSGTVGWSDRVDRGREDLLAVAERLAGKRPPGSQEAMSEWEAYAVDNLQTLNSVSDFVVGNEREPVTALTRGCTSDQPTANMRDRVVDRWFRTNACLCETARPETIEMSIRFCRGRVHRRANELYEGARRRATALLGSIENLSRGLDGAPGRKSIIVLAEGLLRDTDPAALDRAMDASRRANTAVSFVDIRGLIGAGFYGAQETAPPKAGDIGLMAMEAAVVETAGGEVLAQNTGGAMVRGNDLAEGLGRLTDEESAYYLLGYQPERSPDGGWRKLEVKVSRPGVKVRARRGYLASSDAGPPPRVASASKNAAPVRKLDPAIGVGRSGGSLPVQVAPYILETDASRTARVLVAIEVDTRALAFEAVGEERIAHLDVTVVGVSRDAQRKSTVDSRVALTMDRQAAGSRWTFTRELRLPAGPAQIRALVKEVATTRRGLTVERIEVPSPDVAYLSTPILGDRLREPKSPREPPGMVPTATRRFERRGTLHCAYEVYVAPAGREMKTIPYVEGGYTLQDATGKLVTLVPPTRIAMALGGHLSRQFTVPLDHLAAGQYRLIVQTVDRTTGENLHAETAFEVEAEGAREP